MICEDHKLLTKRIALNSLQASTKHKSSFSVVGLSLSRIELFAPKGNRSIVLAGDCSHLEVTCNYMDVKWFLEFAKPDVLPIPDT